MTADSSEQRADTQAPARETPVQETLNILLVDDVAEMRLMLRTVLRRRPGVRIVAEAEDGHAAVELAAEHQPDIVVLDLGLPDLEGADVLSGIRNRAPRARVVVFTGRMPGDDPIASRVEGFVSKQQDLPILIEAIEAAGRHPFQVKSVDLPAEAQSARLARAFAIQTLSTWGLDELVADCAIVVSELVTNAVVHAGSRSELRLSNHPHSVRVAVVDYGTGTPEPLAPSDSRLGGRGLQIVSSLATAWGVDGADGGRKLVWAELPHLDLVGA
jgi:CheY-like chemotaxis protein